MIKIGRNEPCHCGSGKKYKKCCLIKDEAAEKERPAREFLEPLSEDNIIKSGFFDGIDEDIDKVFDEDFREGEYDNIPKDPSLDEPYYDEDNPDLPKEDNKLVNEWWDKYKEFEGPVEERQHLENFIEGHPDLVIYLGLEHEVLFELGNAYLKLGKIDDHIQFLIGFRQQFPDVYLKSFGYYDADIIAWLISKNRRDEVSGYLGNFIKDPVECVEKLFEVINLLQATDMTSDLLLLVNGVYGPVCNSEEVFGGYEILTPLVTEIFTKYLKPDFSDDDLDNMIAELKGIAVELDEEYYTQSYWRPKFETILQPYSVWAPEQPITKDKIYELHYNMSINYMRFLKEKTGISWISSNYFSMLMNEFLHSWHQDTKKRNNALFDFSKGVMDKQISKLSIQMGMFFDITKTIGLFNAIYYFAEYLVACGNINESQALTIQNNCTNLHGKIYPKLKKHDVEAYVFANFPRWG